MSSQRIARVTGILFLITFITSIPAALVLYIPVLDDPNYIVGAGASSFVGVGRSLVAIHDWTFLLGPGWVVGVGNGLILGYLMYRSGLVPRGLAMLGLIGGPLIIASGTAILFGLFEPGSAPQVIATVPEFFWELLLGIYLIVKGFQAVSYHLQYRGSSGVREIQASADALRVVTLVI